MAPGQAGKNGAATPGQTVAPGQAGKNGAATPGQTVAPGQAGKNGAATPGQTVAPGQAGKNGPATPGQTVAPGQAGKNGAATPGQTVAPGQAGKTGAGTPGQAGKTGAATPGQTTSSQLQSRDALTVSLTTLCFGRSVPLSLQPAFSRVPTNLRRQRQLVLSCLIHGFWPSTAQHHLMKPPKVGHEDSLGFLQVFKGCAQCPQSPSWKLEALPVSCSI